MVGVLAVTFLIFIAVYLLEPFWRHQAMTALGLAVSAGRSTTNGLLAGLGGILAVWISQGIVVYLLVLGMSVINNLMYSLVMSEGYHYRFDYDVVMHIQMIMLLAACVTTGVVIFIYYSLLQRINLNTMQRRAFNS
jgi:hypothetical protein